MNFFNPYLNGSGVDNKERRSKQLRKTIISCSTNEKKQDKAIKKIWKLIHLDESSSSSSQQQEEAKLDVNAVLRASVHRNHTPLTLACKYKLCNVVKYLVTKEMADVNQPNGDGRAALHYACNKGSLEISRFLIDHNADINLKTNNSGEMTPFLVACKYGANSTIVSEMIRHPETDVNATNNTGKTALHYAVYNGNVDFCKMLLDKQANPYLIHNIHAKDRDQKTPLHIACRYGDNYKILKLLIDASPNVDRLLTATRKGEDILGYAESWKSKKCIRVIKEAIRPPTPPLLSRPSPSPPPSPPLQPATSPLFSANTISNAVNDAGRTPRQHPFRPEFVETNNDNCSISSVDTDGYESANSRSYKKPVSRNASFGSTGYESGSLGGYNSNRRLRREDSDDDGSSSLDHSVSSRRHISPRPQPRTISRTSSASSARPAFLRMKSRSNSINSSGNDSWSTRDSRSTTDSRSPSTSSITSMYRRWFSSASGTEKINYDAFIIHTGKQRATEVGAMHYVFRKKGYKNCFVDKLELTVPRGDNVKYMEEALEKCRHIVVVLSDDFLHRNDPCAELGYAYRRMKWLQMNNLWNSLWIVLYDISADDYKRAWRKTGEKLPAIHDCVQFKVYNSDGGSNYPFWINLCKTLVKEMKDYDRRHARSSWQRFLKQHATGQLFLKQHATEDTSFPRASGVYKMSKEETGCLS